MTKEVIAVDLGGTHLRVSLVKNGKIKEYIKRETPKIKKKLLKELCGSIESLMNSNVKGIGVGFAGPLDNDKIRNPPNLPLKNFNLKKYLKRKFKVRVEIENDANCVALAEAKLGWKKKNFIVMTLGTGIGGGIVINGKLYKGKDYAGELGHIILDNGKELEDLWKQYRIRSKKEFGKTLLILDLIKKNNKKSKKILKETSNYLGQGIASLINVLDPELVILSGGIKETGKEFLGMIQKKTKKYVFVPNPTKVKWTKLKHPGSLGASLLID